MKTDMLSWTKLNPTVKTVPVKKMFHGQYLNKIVVYCPAARTILVNSEYELTSVLHRRISDRLLYNWGGSWSNAYQSEILQKHSNLDQLKYFHRLYKNRKDTKIQFRIEEPYISIYSNDEQYLYDIIDGSLCNDRLLEVHRPSSIYAKNHLLKGEIVSSNYSAYNFKIYLKSYRFESLKQQKDLANKLSNLEDCLKIPNKIKNFFQSDNLFFSGGYFYCKDEETITFIRLAMPELVSSIFKLGYVSS